MERRMSPTLLYFHSSRAFRVSEDDDEALPSPSSSRRRPVSSADCSLLGLTVRRHGHYWLPRRRQVYGEVSSSRRALTASPPAAFPPKHCAWRIGIARFLALLRIGYCLYGRSVEDWSLGALVIVLIMELHESSSATRKRGEHDDMAFLETTLNGFTATSDLCVCVSVSLLRSAQCSLVNAGR
ncbi:hypothetical protein ABZP36_002130 [Zizania latifolia]